MTEMITGVDLIAEQIRAAQGEVLRYKQEDIQLKVSTKYRLSSSLSHICDECAPLNVPKVQCHSVTSGWTCRLKARALSDSSRRPCFDSSTATCLI